jgi:hypothetical protein
VASVAIFSERGIIAYFAPQVKKYNIVKIEKQAQWFAA